MTQPRYVYRATLDKHQRPALIGPGGFYEGFTIDLPSYWRARVIGLLKDPSTYAAQAMLTVVGQMASIGAVIMEKLIKRIIRKRVREILHKKAGVDYETSEKVADEVAEVAFRLIFLGMESVTKYFAKKILFKVAKRVADKLADIIVPPTKKKNREIVIKRMLRKLANTLLKKILRFVFKKAVRYMLNTPGRIGKILRGVAKLGPAVIIDFALQAAIECAIDTVEFLLWPTKAVGRYGGVGLMGGPNVLGSLVTTYNFVISRKYLGIHAQGFRPKVRNPRKTGLRPAGRKARKPYLPYTLVDFDKAPRWVYSLRKPQVRHAARLGEVARYFIPALKTWSFKVTDLVVRLLPGKLAAIVYMGKGTLKIQTAIPLTGAAVAEALARELNPRDDLSTDALQGYYYHGGVAFGFPCLGAAGLVKMGRQDYYKRAMIHHSLNSTGNIDYTTFSWAPPGVQS